MNRSIIFIFICFLCLSSFNIESRYIRWSSARSLVWGDFQGKPTSEDGAVTYAFLDRKFYKSNSNITFLKAVFDKQKSWVVVPDSLGLIHEQGHFDIVEIYARKFNNDFNDAKIRAEENVLDLQDKKFDVIIEEMEKTQANYDKETECYLNQQEQERWNKWIKKQLDSIPKIEFD